MASFLQDGHIAPFTALRFALNTLCHAEIWLQLSQVGRGFANFQPK